MRPAAMTSSPRLSTCFSFTDDWKDEPMRGGAEPACEGVSLSRCEAEPSPMRRRSLSPPAKALA
jgi:hypothetical protein